MARKGGRPESRKVWVEDLPALVGGRGWPLLCTIFGPGPVIPTLVLGPEALVLTLRGSCSSFPWFSFWLPGLFLIPLLLGYAG